MKRGGSYCRGPIKQQRLGFLLAYLTNTCSDKYPSDSFEHEITVFLFSSDFDNTLYHGLL